MVDLHCHILPGLDDGPATMDDSLEMARVAAANGIATIVATPHVRDDHPYPLERIDSLVAELNELLAGQGIALRVRSGGEVAVAKLHELSDDVLGRLRLGDGRHLLVESPYTHATDLLEQEIFSAHIRGFPAMLAHPERSPSFLSDPDRLAALVERGVLCSITAGSMAGRFGRTVQRFTALLFERGLVHDVASDAHGPVGRAPALQFGFEALDEQLPGLLRQAGWYTRAAPEAVLAGTELPSRPEPVSRPGALRRLFARR